MARQQPAHAPLKTFRFNKIPRTYTMPRVHRTAAFCVLAAATAWIVTGEFSSVGSAQDTAGPETPTVEAATDTAPLLRTVAARLARAGCLWAAP